MVTPSPVTVLTATRLETRAARRAAPDARIVEAGIALRRLSRREFTGAVITCGLAGAVRSGLPTGSVLVPSTVLRPDGTWLTCDRALAEALAAAARTLGLEAEQGPLGTSPSFVRGADRQAWADRGCVAVDMETGLLTAPRIAAVRVVLDTPERDLSDVWRRPVLALARPAAWGEAAWLVREAPRCAARAAAVLAEALRPPGAPLDRRLTRLPARSG
ncbi:MAG TPA: hypothetical protein VGZ23_01210 [bacterium]|nr:hypothetical protein [bacterium]